MTLSCDEDEDGYERRKRMRLRARRRRRREKRRRNTRKTVVEAEAALIFRGFLFIWKEKPKLHRSR